MVGPITEQSGSLAPDEGVRHGGLLGGTTELAHLLCVAPAHRARSKGVREVLDGHEAVGPAGVRPVLLLVLLGRHLHGISYSRSLMPYGGSKCGEARSPFGGKPTSFA